jgi:diaminopimelate decarboxylase
MSASGRARMGSHDFKYHDGVLHIESTNLELLAQCFGTPLYVYSRAAITAAWQRISQAFDGDTQRVHYAAKANSNLTIPRLVAIWDAGAYGFSMNSNYNSRPRAAEILVDGADAAIIRRRETLDDLMRLEDLPMSDTNS